MFQPPPAHIGVLCPAAPTRELRSVLAFLETALGVPVRLVGAEGPWPERLLVLGAVSPAHVPESIRIQLHLPPPEFQTRPRREWIEPGPIPVFGDCERFPGSDDLPWHYLGGGTPVSWASRGPQTLFKLGFDPLGPLFGALARSSERGPRGAAWRRARVSDLPPDEKPLALTPWVDRLVLLLARLLDLEERESGNPTDERWPGGARWAVALSHDVDMLFKWRFRSVIRLLLESPPQVLGGGLPDLARRWRELLRRWRDGRDPWFLVDELLDLEERRGLHSTLLFLAEPRDHQTFRYHLDRAQVRGLLLRIRQRGYEVALHGGWSSFRSARRLAFQRGRLESLAGQRSPATRQHWLRFDVARTWEAQQEAGFSVDSSLGFNDRPGFRAGTSLPFHPLGDDGGPLGLLEMPLVLMDSQLFDEQGLEPPAAARLAQEAVEQVRRVRGLLTLNWHPHTLCREDFPGRRELFEEILGVVTRRDCWAAGLGDVAGHWLAREARLAASGVTPPAAGPVRAPAAGRESLPCEC